MTPSPEQLDLARRDMDAIRHLREDKHFNGYFLRCLRARKQLANAAAIHEKAASTREESRLLCVAFESIERMMDEHEAEMKALIEEAANPKPFTTTRPPSLAVR